MPIYEVSLTHSYLVEIEAKSAKDAAQLSEFFVTYSDGSLEVDRQKYRFLIQNIEMTINEAFEVKQLKD